jgi:hypothetical protein
VHLLLMRWCWQMLAPPHSLHLLLMRWCCQMLAPPHPWRVHPLAPLNWYQRVRAVYDNCRTFDHGSAHARGLGSRGQASGGRHTHNAGKLEKRFRVKSSEDSLGKATTKSSGRHWRLLHASESVVTACRGKLPMLRNCRADGTSASWHLRVHGWSPIMIQALFVAID